MLHSSDDPPHLPLEYHEFLEVIECDMVLPRKGLFHHSFKVGIEATDREVRVSNGRLEVVSREEALAIPIEEVVGLSQIFCPDQHPLRDD